MSLRDPADGGLGLVIGNVDRAIAPRMLPRPQALERIAAFFKAPHHAYVGPSGVLLLAFDKEDPSKLRKARFSPRRHVLLPVRTNCTKVSRLQFQALLRSYLCDPYERRKAPRKKPSTYSWSDRPPVQKLAA